jgi:hypothetical protein
LTIAGDRSGAAGDEYAEHAAAPAGEKEGAARLWEFAGPF